MGKYGSQRMFSGMVLCALVLFFVTPLFFPIHIERLAVFSSEHYVEGVLTFVALMAVVTVVAPLSLPLAVPAVAHFLGPLSTALGAILGWSLGAGVAFALARRFGRPLIARYVAPERLTALTRRVPTRGLFMWMLIARMLFPVDVLSYALGLLPSVRVVPYLLATVFGTAPFAFLFAYAGDAVLLHEYDKVAGLALVGALLSLAGWRWFLSARNSLCL